MLEAGRDDEPLWIAATAFVEALIRKQLHRDNESQRLLRLLQRAQKELLTAESRLALFRQLLLPLAAVAPQTRLQRLIHQYWRPRDWLQDAALPLPEQPLIELDQALVAAAQHAQTLWEEEAAWPERIEALFAVARALYDRPDPEIQALAAALEAFAQQLPDAAATDPARALLLATTLLALKQDAQAGTLTAARCRPLVDEWHAALSGQQPHTGAPAWVESDESLTQTLTAEVTQLCGEIEHALDTFWRTPEATLPLDAIKKALDQLAAICVVTDHTALLSEIDAVRTWLQTVAAGKQRFDPQNPLIAQIATWGQRISQPAPPSESEPHPTPIPWDRLFPQHLASLLATDATATDAVQPTLEPAPPHEPRSEADETTRDAPQPEPSATPVATADDTRASETDSDETAELRAIFLAECDEILAAMHEARAQLERQPTHRDALTQWRRQVHTLKGSSRIVGLTQLGETAWEVEQTLNHCLRHPDFVPSADFLAFLAGAENAFAQAATTIAQSGEDLPAPIAELVEAAQRWRATPRSESEGAPPQPTPPHAASGAAPREAPTPERVAPQSQEPSTPAEAAFGQHPDWHAIDFEPEAAAAPQPVPSQPAPPQPDRYFTFGDRKVSRTIFEIFRTEAREHLASLARFLHDPETPSDAVVRAAHTLASICGTAQIPEMHDLARAWELRLLAMQRAGEAPNDQDLTLFHAVHTALHTDLVTVEDGKIPPRRDDLIATLETPPAAAPEPSAAATSAVPSEAPIVATFAVPAEAPAAASSEGTPETPSAALPSAVSLEPHQEPSRQPETEPSGETEDHLDTALLPIFAEEGRDLFAQLEAALAQLPEPAAARPETFEPILRLLHTLKGSARMAGALALGDRIHQIEQHLKEAPLTTAQHALPDLIAAARAHFLQLLTQPTEPPAAAHPETQPLTPPTDEPKTEAPLAASAVLPMTLRIPAPTIDRWVNELSEIAIQRARAESELVTLRQAANDLTENVQRLRHHLRELEIQAEAQLQARIQVAETHHTEFDPLEMDRYTRLQELTRILAEGIADVGTLQQSIVRTVDAAEVSLHRQSRQTRDLQAEITALRAVPVATLYERFTRLVAQTAETLGKRVEFALFGGETRVDRAALERLTPALEHLLRNAVAHGIETPAERQALGKSPTGRITLTVYATQGETQWTLADDGRGLDAERIAAKAREKGWLAPNESPTESELLRFIFRSGFSTADTVSQIAGRGVGLDVVQAEIAALGGRIDVASEPGRGVRFQIRIPTELALTQLLLVTGHGRRWGIPTEWIVHTQQFKAEALESLWAAGTIEHRGETYPLVGLHTLIAAPEPAREGRHWVILTRIGDERIAMWVEAIAGRQELAAKPTGPFLRRVGGILGAVLLPDGEITLILHPTQLFQTARQTTAQQPRAAHASARRAATPSGAQSDTTPETQRAAPLILVVDDSLTVRRLTQRLLERQGYRVLTAKDGQEALEKLQDAAPAAILSDIEMPRMDGFELLRHLRAHPTTRNTPVIMITSRLAEKHRTHAFELGATDYLGKPYQEETLLALLARHAPLSAPAAG
nr:Hpt domain-containing protein [Hydrogenophilus thiooxidans]